MFKIESYVTPILLSYVDKYVRDFKPADAQVSLWGGGVALHNLVIKPDVLQQQVSIPFTLISGRIHELLIQVPWTKIMSEPIVVTIDTIECILGLRPPTSLEEGPPPDSPSHKSQVVEAPPGYMQALVRRIVSNITLRVHHLIVKYVQDDIVLSLNVKHLSVDAAGPDWEPAFADIDQNVPLIRRLVRLDDFTLCLDHSDADGKIRFYQEPLLYRCQIDLRVLTRLVSANTRRAKSLSVQLRSSKLAWGVTSDQLTLLLRLIKERPLEVRSPQPATNLTSKPQSTTPLRITGISSSNTAEPARRESWSEWAWSWLPKVTDREGSIEEAPTVATCTPIYFVAFFDDVSLVYKVMETDGSNRKRARGIMELQAKHAAVKTTVKAPTFISTRIGTRSFIIQSQGKCACGYLNYNASNDRPTVYVAKTQTEECEEAWDWPEEEFSDNVEMADAVDKEFRDDRPEDLGGSNLKTRSNETIDPFRSDNISLFDYKINNEATESFWSKMAPLIYMEFQHERSPPTAYTNPYDNPPTDFQYSDWEEQNNMIISLQPMDICVSVDLIHRLEAVWTLYREQAVVVNTETPRTLTVEERDALYENLPQRRINIDLKGLRIRLEPWDHNLSDKPIPTNLVLDLDFQKAKVAITGPLYPHRVCSAACQMTEKGPLWQGARLHITATFPAIEAKICSPSDGVPKSCARADLKFVVHLLLHQQYFTNKESVLFSYTLKTREVNISGSTARLMAAVKIPLSLIKHKVCVEIGYTSLPGDAINDEESVAMDITFEEYAIRGYVTSNVNTHIMTLQSTRATLIHATEGKEPKQAWLFSVRDVPSTTPFLRMAIQWCEEQQPNSIDYLGIWTEPIDFCVDPLFISWLAYKPTLNPISDIQSQMSLSKVLSSYSSHHFMRRRPPSVPSSSGRGGSRTGSGAELVHARPRSVESCSELSDKKDKPPPKVAKPIKAWINGEQMIKLHQRLRHVLINVELGLVVVYVTMTTASAVDCATPHMTMERHATSSNHVLGINIGRWNLHSSSATRDMWQDIRHDGPTFITAKTEQTPAPADSDISFPWKVKFADVSCYTMVVRAGVDRCGREKSSHGLRSQLKTDPTLVQINTILEMVTTTVTLSVVTKALQYKTFVKKPDRKKTAEATKEEKKMKYFTAGTTDFKPTTLKEFVRGPAKRTKSSADQTDPIGQDTGPDHKITSGPIVSFGFHVHADTPPVIVKLEQEQVHVVGAAFHCFNHIVALLERPPLIIPKGYVPGEASQKSFIRSVSELEEQQSLSESARSESRSELIPIFDPNADRDNVKISAFFWFQWVISRAALVVATYQVKLTFDVDDIISTIDLQEHYNQVKLKLASASVKHYEKNENDEWKSGALGGRVLEAREPVTARQENNFLSVTITQAQISNLPESWKEELHPKLLQSKSAIDRVWEIYATLAPLEAVLEPSIVENIICLAREMKPRAYCSLQTEVKRSSTWQWPFVYLSAGGLRLLATCNKLEKKTDDTLMFIIGKITANPHPENPICRRPINSCDAGWATVDGGFEGRQYELLFKNISVRSAQFLQLVNQELSETRETGENPAHMWSQHVLLPVVTPILHSLDVGCVLAPAHYMADVIVCGPGIELNLMSDCSVELSIYQLALVQKVIRDMQFSFKEGDLESVMIFDNEQHGLCPYTMMSQGNKFELEEPPFRNLSNATVLEEDPNAQSDKGRSITDSGVEISASRSTLKSNRFPEDNVSLKKKMAVGFSETQLNSSDYLEIFVTMGTIEFSLYTADDGSPELVALRPAQVHAPETRTPAPSPAPKKYEKYQFLEKEAIKLSDEEELDGRRSKSLTETIRNEDIGKTNLDIVMPLPHARRGEGNLPLIYVTFHQPNLYYWKKKSQKGFQVSLFNAWIGFGGGLSDDHLNAVLLSTARGEPDPVTEIPPALATMKLTLPSSGNLALGSNSTTSSRGSMRLDVERPVLLEISTDKMTRLKGILSLVQRKQLNIPRRQEYIAIRVPILQRVRRFMVHHSIETATVQTSQMGVIGPDGTAGWDSASLQVSWGARPERLSARALVSSLLVASGPSHDARLPVLQPLQLGMELEVTWEAWRRAEGGKSARHPTVSLGIELDRVSIDARPSDLVALNNIRQMIALFILDKSDSSEDMVRPSVNNPASVFAKELNNRSSFDGECNDHYYKDDLRSGAFKIVSGGQLPMAYQVTLYRNSVSWRYPHPRAITRLIAFPLPGRDKEIDCVLELYNSILSQWEPHSYFKVPVNEPNELHPHVAPPEAVFSTIWRFRVYSKSETKTPFEFDMNKFLPKIDTVITEREPDQDDPMGMSEVTAEELSGILRVDSYFAPRLMPRLRLSVRLTALEVHAHNSLLSHYSKTSNLEGYYVSKPLMRSHRVLTFTSRDVAVHGNFGCKAGKLMLIDTQISGDVLDCATGTMEQLVDEFRVQAAVSMPREGLEHLRLRFRTSNVHAMLHVPRLRTLHALAIDWKMALEEHLLNPVSSPESNEDSMKKSKLNEDVTTASLEGRVSLWVENSCASALRVGQEGTDEVLPLGPGATLAYRWRSPAAVRKLRFAFANPTADWHWSNSISFTPGFSRVRMEDVAPTSSDALPVDGVYAYVNVKQTGAKRFMQISGRLVLANMLRFGLHYKVRARSLEIKTWRALIAGEIAAETVGRSVICSASCEMVLKIKLAEQNSGWSGDIPLKECPKENVPWLVKVPSEGEVPYVSVWCRVVRARSDGRILATIWPLYVLRSNLPLDTDVLIVTESTNVPAKLSDEEKKPPPIIQVAPGRGSNIHLSAPGTTSARHSLSFQYRNIECPVTREAVPLHYGVTDTSVFDKRAPVNNINEVTQDVHAWLERSARTVTPSWPYSIVSKHWPEIWQPAQLQPRCDVTIRYQAVRAGGGCSLEVQLSPVLLLCNASPISLTMRAHDASPLCKTEPGTAISLPSAMLQKPFFMSVETGRDAFVSGPLEVCSTNPGRYGAPAPGHVAIDHSANFAIQCNQKVAMLTLYYEIKEDINILGISAPYMLINKLDTDLLVSSIAVPKDAKEVPLRTMSFKVVQPCPEERINGIPLCRFWLHDRWRGGNATELNLYVCLALPLDSYPAGAPVPVRLGAPPVRRALALIDGNNKSLPVVVIQHRHEGRWLVTVAPDPCPQFLVHNSTEIPLVIAQPVNVGDEPSSSSTTTVADCSGVHWWCTVEPGAVTHYSSPAHCERHPATAESTSVPLPFLTFARYTEDDHEHIWCSPIAVADGEQLVQLDSGNTVKLRIRTHAHSTLIELQDVDQHDIAASDIRKRLVGPIFSDPTCTSLEIDSNIQHDNQLERVHGDNKLLDSVGNQRRPSEHTLLIFSETSIGVLKLALTSTHQKDSSKNLKIKNPDNNKDVNLNTMDIEQDTVKDENTNIKDFQVDNDQYPSTSSGTIKRKSLKIQESETIKDEIVNKESSIASDDNLKTNVSEAVKDDTVNIDEQKSVYQDSSIASDENLKTNVSEAVKDDTVNIDEQKSVNKESSIASDENLKTNVSEAVKDDTVNIDEHKLLDESEADFADTGSQYSLNMLPSALIITPHDPAPDTCSYIYQGNRESVWEEDIQLGSERIRCVMASMAVEMAVAGDTRPLFAVHLDRATVQISALSQKTKTTLSIADVQIDNLQYETGQYDFAVVATTRAEPLEADQWPALWNMFADRAAFATREKEARLLLKITHDKWKVGYYKYNELTEFEIRLGPLALYVEDAYVTALIELFQLASASAKPSELQSLLSEVHALQCPLRFRLLYIHPLDLTLTLHTAVRVYIALDQSPLHLSAFELRNMMTSRESLAHALTVHYLSAAILGAGWVVGGLELLGAPGALAARVGGATGGVRGIASAAAAALLRSLSAWAGSLARNLDLLAGDEEHARRAAAARRRPPDNLVDGLIAGITNFAINILGAVGGLAHHPLVGVAVGETESGATALRRGLLGALTKPLSATADLVAYAGHGLLRQTGWDPVPQPRSSWSHREMASAGWKRDCVRWTFRLAELNALAGFEVLLDNASLQLLLTHKFLVVADSDSEHIVEMIDFRFCELRPYQGAIVELCVTQRRTPKTSESRGIDEDDEYQISAAAMARVARYTGAEGATSAEARVLSLLPMPGQSHALYAALAAAIHHNADSHFALL